MDLLCLLEPLKINYLKKVTNGYTRRRSRSTDIQATMATSFIDNCIVSVDSSASTLLGSVWTTTCHLVKDLFGPDAQVVSWNSTSSVRKINDIVPSGMTEPHLMFEAFSAIDPAAVNLFLTTDGSIGATEVARMRPLVTSSALQNVVAVIVGPSPDDHCYPEATDVPDLDISVLSAFDQVPGLFLILYACSNAIYLLYKRGDNNQLPAMIDITDETQYHHLPVVYPETLKGLQVTTLQLNDASFSLETLESLMTDSDFCAGQEVYVMLDRLLGQTVAGMVDPTTVWRIVSLFHETVNRTLKWLTDIYPMACPGEAEYITATGHFIQWYRNRHAIVSRAQLMTDRFLTALTQENDFRLMTYAKPVATVTDLALLQYDFTGCQTVKCTLCRQVRSQALVCPQGVNPDSFIDKINRANGQTICYPCAVYRHYTGQDTVTAIPFVDCHSVQNVESLRAALCTWMVGTAKSRDAMLLLVAVLEQLRPLCLERASENIYWFQRSILTRPGQSERTNASSDLVTRFSRWFTT